VHGSHGTTTPTHRGKLCGTPEPTKLCAVAILLWVFLEFAIPMLAEEGLFLIG
jgi:hypothetical protein